MDLTGKTAIITGAGTGIGAAIARTLADAGCRVMLAGRREDMLAAVAETIAQTGGTAKIHRCDVTDEAACSRLVAATTAAFGGVDILVNNAGISGHGKKLVTWNAADFDRIVGTNLKSAFLMSRAAIPVMIDRGGGCIVMLSSISGTRYYPDEVLYGLSKHAMNDLAQFINVEYGAGQIRSVAICPALVATDMGNSLHPKRPERMLSAEQIADWTLFAIRHSQALSIAQPIVLATALDPHEP